MNHRNSLLFILIVLLSSSCDEQIPGVLWQGRAEQAYIMGLRAQKGEIRDTDAMTCFNSAIALDPKQSSYYRSRSGLYFLKGDYRLACVDLDSAIAISPNWHFLYYERGFCKCGLGDFESALKDFERAIQGQPENDQFYSGIALVGLAMNNQNKAIAAINEAISLAPKFEKWHYQKAIILSRGNRRKEALAEFARTEACTLMLKNNEQLHVYFDGEYEFAKARHASLSQVIRDWTRAPAIENYSEH